MRGSYIYVLIAVSLSVRVQGQAQKGSAIDEFRKLLPGFYSTEAMWKRDSSFSNVQLHIIPLWTHENDGYWFYLEQAEVKNLNKPYRQAVLHVTSRGDSIVSRNIAIKNRLQFAGAWNDEKLIQALTKDNLDLSNVCEIVFQQASEKSFKGGTRQGGCPNQYRGASYFTNESALTQQALKSWDRGWTKGGELAWGPATGGYTFDRVKP